VSALLFPIVGSGQAGADYAPQPGDVVGVGGDTPQYAIDFGLNGDANADLGFDAGATVNRVVDFDATPDANGRKAYTNSVTSGAASVALNPTDVLRSGEVTAPRVSSSGASIAALLADYNAANPSQAEKINYIFSASLPTIGNQTTAGNQGWGYLHAVEIGTDSVQIAVNSTGTGTNAPAGLSTTDLLNIYTGTYKKWGDIPGYAGPAPTDSIQLDLPSSSSTIYTTLLADLKSDNGNVTPTAYSPDIKTVEQNDPTAITGASNKADVIEPFSAARLSLWNSGYFHDPGTGSSAIAWPGGASLTPGVTLLTGTSPTGGTAYASPLTDYVIFRESDATGGSPLEPGGTLNWVQTLFSNPGGSQPFFQKSSTRALLLAAGITPAYSDLGNVNNGQP
jgi:hypothetical protein